MNQSGNWKCTVFSFDLKFAEFLKMSKLVPGTAMHWEEIRKFVPCVKQIGIGQFISIFNQHKDRKGDARLWGDEIEYTLIKFNNQEKCARVSLRAPEFLKQITENRNNNCNSQNESELGSIWMPEFAEYMVEGIPGVPYGETLRDLTQVEANMKARRKKAQAHLQPDEMLLTISKFPRLGCPGFTWPEYKPDPYSSIYSSQFFPREAIYSGHERFLIGTRNAQERSGSRCDTHIPIFKDANTLDPFLEPDIPEHQPNMIYVQGFGFGLSCLQVTLQARNLNEARLLYDNLAPLCPIMLALTAATPFCRGYISDLDTRWKLMTSALDCRTSKEKPKIHKPRYCSVSSYLSPENAAHNDIPLPYDEEHYNLLVDAGIDPVLAQHVAHLFIRDPLILYAETINQDTASESGHFDNIQSSNWQSLRFKPPPLNSTSVGWRVEFRPCEVQLTDFENAAVSCFVYLLTRIIIESGRRFVVPISKVDENFEKSHLRNAVIDQMFWFQDPNSNAGCSLQTMEEIINGENGIVPLIQKYLDSMELETETKTTLSKYLSLISQRASGYQMTPAKWMRCFVDSHQDYKQDSIVSEKINYDLLRRIGKLESDFFVEVVPMAD